MEFISAHPDYIVKGKKQYFVYIITNKYNTTLYTGVTNNLNRRMAEHIEKSVEGFSRRYNLNKLVYYEIFGNSDEAIKREKQVKKYSKLKKSRLIESINPLWGDLYPGL